MRIAFVSDIHEDYDYLLKPLRKIEKLNCNKVVCLGDIVGYSIPYYNYLSCRDANSCISKLSEVTSYIIGGNHDWYSIRKIPNSKTADFIFPNNWYSMHFDDRKIISNNKVWLYEDNELSALLSAGSVSKMQSFKEEIVLQADNISLLLTHYLLPDLSGSTTRFVLSYNDFIPHSNYMKEKGVNLSIFGHTHPCGISVLDESSDFIKVQQKVKLLPTIKGIGVPAVCRSKSFSGFAVLDTQSMIIEAISTENLFNIT